MTAKHFLTMTVSSEGFVQWLLECRAQDLDAKVLAGCATWSEKDPYICVCTCDPCGEDDHDACEQGGPMEEIGPACKIEPDDICGAKITFEEIGGELIGDLGLITEYPIPIKITWQGDYPELVKWTDS